MAKSIQERITSVERKVKGLCCTPNNSDGEGSVGPQGPIGPQGVQGPAGADGAVGPAGLEWQGAWVSGTSYVADDAVGYNGASWFCILATSGNQPPNLDTTHWALLASQGAQGTTGVQGPSGAQGPSGSSDWTKTGNNIYNNNTGKVSIGAGADLNKAQLSVRGIQNDINGGIAITTAGGTDWRMYGSDVNAVQNGNGSGSGFHITGTLVDSAFWIGGWGSTVSNSFQSPTSSVLATPVAIRGVVGQTADLMQIRSNRTVTTGDIMTVKSTGLVTLPTVTNALIEADTTNKAIATKEYVNNRLVSEKNNSYSLVDADSGGIIIFTANATLTIPTELAVGFECTFVTLADVTLTVVSTGNVLNNALGNVLAPKSSFTLKRMIATNTFIATGNL